MPSIYQRYVLPKVIACACGSRPIWHQRRKVVPKAEGRVLELGIGGGLNLAFYDPARVSSVVGIDPSEPLRRMAREAPRPEGLVVEILASEAEAVPFGPAEFDTVVCTFTLCSVHTPAACLAEARRVLKAGGRLLFSEHGLSPDADVQRWQRRVEPVWKRLAGGCHLTRPVATSIAASGFDIARLEIMYLPKTPRLLGWCEWGMAMPR